MDSKRIEELLNRYWECETSLEEEQQLREYFQGNSIPDQHKETAALFKYFHENKNKSLSDASFDSAVLSKVQVKRGKVVKLFYNSMRIAAGIAVVMTATWFVRNEVRQTTPQEVVDTYNDPQLAFEETKKALMMISKGFGQAEHEAKKINLFNEAQQEIQKSNKSESQL
jgi:hypothetical protein